LKRILAILVLFLSFWQFSVFADPILNKLDEDSGLLLKLKTQSPIKKGSSLPELSELMSRKIKVGGEKTETLSNVIKMAFQRQDEFSLSVRNISLSSGILAQSPEILSEVYEFQDSYAIVKSTSIVVVKPSELKSIAPASRNFLGVIKSKSGVKVSALKPEELAWFRSFIKNEVPKLSSNDPLKIAAGQGEEALLQAVSEGKGRFTVVESLIVPKEPYPIIDGVVQLPFSDRYISSIFSSSLDTGLNERLSTRPDLNTTTQDVIVELPKITEKGEFRFHTKFMAGFSYGNEWVWDDSWSFAVGSISLSAGLRYGIACRVPIDVEGKVSPIDIFVEDTKDREREFKMNIKAVTKDGDINFYRDTGVPEDLLFGGNELYFGLEVGFGYRIRAFGENLVTPRRFRWHKIGETIKENFTPPLGDSRGGPTIGIPPHMTGTEFSVGVASASIQLGFKITGDGEIHLDYKPNFAGRNLKKETLVFNSSNYKEPPTTVMLSAMSGDNDRMEEGYGFVLDHPRYKIDLELIPALRIDAEVDYGIDTWDINTDWIYLNFLAIGLGRVTLDRHAGTRKELKYTEGKKKFRRISEFEGEIKDGDIISIQSEGANGNWVRSDIGLIECNLGAISREVHVREAFKYIDLGGGKFGLQCVKNGLYVTCRNNVPLAAVSQRLSEWETFKLTKVSDRVCAFQAVNNRKYVGIGNDANKLLMASASNISGKEKFKFYPVFPVDQVLRELPAEETNNFIGLKLIKTGKYVRAGLLDMCYLGASSSHFDIWEIFHMEKRGTIRTAGGRTYDKIVLRSAKNNKYVSAVAAYGSTYAKLLARNSQIKPECEFGLMRLRNDKVALWFEPLSANVVADRDGDCLLRATGRDWGADEWSQFKIVPLVQARTTSRSQWEGSRLKSAEQQTEQEEDTDTEVETEEGTTESQNEIPAQPQKEPKPHVKPVYTPVQTVMPIQAEKKPASQETTKPKPVYVPLQPITLVQPEKKPTSKQTTTKKPATSSANTNKATSTATTTAYGNTNWNLVGSSTDKKSFLIQPEKTETKK
jgi:hypothetical protein